MTYRVPVHVRQSVKEIIYKRADESCYLAQSRTDNGAFLDALSKDPMIQMYLLDYMPEANIRTYIKDAVLNRYSKDKVAELKDSISNVKLLEKKYGAVSRVASNGSVELYRSLGMPTAYIVLSEGTCLKWETALRKALEFVACLNKSSYSDGTLSICLKCVSPEGPLSSGDKNLLRNALKTINVDLFLIEA